MRTVQLVQLTEIERAKNKETNVWFGCINCSQTPNTSHVTCNQKPKCAALKPCSWKFAIVNKHYTAQYNTSQHTTIWKSVILTCKSKEWARGKVLDNSPNKHCFFSLFLFVIYLQKFVSHFNCLLLMHTCCHAIKMLTSESPVYLILKRNFDVQSPSEARSLFPIEKY